MWVLLRLQLDPDATPLNGWSLTCVSVYCGVLGNSKRTYTDHPSGGNALLWLGIWNMQYFAIQESAAVL